MIPVMTLYCLVDMDCVLYDLETTGFSSSNCEITQISAVSIENHKIARRFNRYVKVSEVPEEVASLTGLTADFLEKEGVSLDVAMREFKEFCQDKLLIAHNGKTFDSRFLRAASAKTGICIDNWQMDSLRLAKKLYPGENHNLGKMAESIGFDSSNAHRAEFDCEMLFSVMEGLIWPRLREVSLTGEIFRTSDDGELILL